MPPPQAFREVTEKKLRPLFQGTLVMATLIFFWQPFGPMGPFKSPVREGFDFASIGG